MAQGRRAVASVWTCRNRYAIGARVADERDGGNLPGRGLAYLLPACPVCRTCLTALTPHVNGPALQPHMGRWALTRAVTLHPMRRCAALTQNTPTSAKQARWWGCFHLRMLGLVLTRRAPVTSGRGGPACAAFDGPASRPVFAKNTYRNTCRDGNMPRQLAGA